LNFEMATGGAALLAARRDIRAGRNLLVDESLDFAASERAWGIVREEMRVVVYQSMDFFFETFEFGGIELIFVSSE